MSHQGGSHNKELSRDSNRPSFATPKPRDPWASPSVDKGRHKDNWHSDSFRMSLADMRPLHQFCFIFAFYFLFVFIKHLKFEKK